MTKNLLNWRPLQCALPSIIKAISMSLGAMLLMSCSEENSMDLASRTLLYCSEGSPDTFNPQLVTSGTTIDAVSHQIYNRLVKIDSKSGRVVPDLAHKIEVSNDAMRYRFFLRKNVAFHNTDYFTPSRTLTSEDILFTFSRILQPSHEYHRVGGGRYPFFSGIGFSDIVEQITVIDEYTIEFSLTDPQASFLANLATDFAIILSAEYANQLSILNRKEQIDLLPIGTGPFKFNHYKRDHYIRYKSHPEFWGDKPQLTQVIFDITPNNSTRLAKLITHECDVFGYPSAADVGYLTGKKGIKIVESTSMNVSYWAFNTNKKPFDNANVRKALTYAVDRAAIIDAVYFNLAEPARNILPPTSWANDGEKYVNDYSLDKARELLSAEGLEDGFEMDIWAMPVQRVYNPNAGKMAEILQQSLAQLNIDAKIVTFDWGTFRKKLAKGEHDSVLIGWLADNSDPDNFFRPLLSCAAAFSGSNRSAWCNPEFDNNILQALSIADHDARKKYYKKADEILFNENPLVPIAHAVRHKIHHDYIKNVNINPYGGIDFSAAQKSKN